MLGVAGRDETQRQVIVVANRLVNFATARADLVERAVHVIVAEHGVEF